MIALVILSPLFVLIALFIKVASPHGRVFYGHQRIGHLGKPFICWKFRTMIPHADQVLQQYFNQNPNIKNEFETNFKLKKDPRIIPWVGHFLRFSSLDELPQLFNILRGEMSWVGPRPITKAEIPRYGDYFTKFISIKPGITGLWQVSGRNDISYDQRVALDMDYIDRLSWYLDCRIVLRTFAVIFLQKGY